jgi:formylglycine-generating enzyme required for sulfatase activity/predicted Ser/Thr protein kinase
MTTKSDNDEEDPSIGSTEMRALCRLVDPVTAQILPSQDELWASRFRILRPIGHGAMGDVYLATDVLLDRPVALKILRTTSEQVMEDARRVLREARAAARADHERVARIYDVGTWCNQSFIAMEYVEGETLRVWMKTRQATTQEVVVLIHQLLDGLRALHKRDIVHRDLKPENIMVDPEGRLRILDLGVARRVSVPNPQPGHDTGSCSLGIGVGTPGYMAPEQWRQGDVDARADIFAVGVIAYELIASRHPLRGGSTPEIRERTLQGKIAFDDGCWQTVPAELKAAVRTALAKDPDQRHPPQLPLLAAPRSDRASDLPDSPSVPSSLGSTVFGVSTRRPVKKPRRWWGLGAFVALAVGALLGLRLRQAALAPATLGMIQFAGGSYTVGLTQAELEAECEKYPNGCLPDKRNETPPRAVTVAPFELDEHEVTNEEFARFLTEVGPLISVTEGDDHRPRFVRYRPNAREDYLLYDLFERLAGIQVAMPSTFSARPNFERLPVTLVTLLGAHLHCKSVGKRLPTDSEWEFAARGVERRPYPWGSQAPTCAGLHIPSRKILAMRDAVLPLPDPDDCDNERTTPFAIMSAPRDRTPDNVFDMAGNIIEWVDDDALLHDAPGNLATRAAADKAGLMRGGAFSSSFGIRTTARFFWVASNVGDNIGFRCAKSSVQ